MALSVSGLASGIDIDSLVTQLSAVARAPLKQLQDKKARIDTAQATVSLLSNKLSTLKNSALALSTSSGFASYTAASSDAAIVASTAGASSPGTYTVEVTQLARAQKMRSASVASATDALGEAADFSLVGPNGTSTISISAGDSLNDVASKISASGARVSASVMNDGTGYRLVVQGLDSGASNAFTLTGGPSSLTMSTFETAQDAVMTVDGLPVTSKSNQVSDVVSGVKMALTKTTTGPVTITVSNDPAALERKVSSLVYAYNDFVTNSHNATGFGTIKAQNPVLATDSAIRGALTRLGSMVGGNVPGTSGSFTTLGSVGFKSNADGTLTVDYAKLQTAMAKDPASVTRLFVNDTTTGATGVMKTMMDAIDGLVKSSTSPLTARLTSLGRQSQLLDDAANKMEDRITRYTTGLKAKFAAMDVAVGKYQSIAKQIG